MNSIKGDCTIAPRVSEVRIDEHISHTFSGVPMSEGPRRRNVLVFVGGERCLNQHTNPFDVVLSGHQKGNITAKLGS